MERVRLGLVRSRAALIGLASAACAVALGAVLAFWLPGRPGSVGATVQPAQVAADPRMLACEKNSTRTIDDVMEVFELSHGRDYRTYLRVPVQPDLMSADQPALVVVFKTGDSSFSSGGNPPLEFTPPPGAHTVCVALTGAATTVFLPNLAAPAIGPLPGTEPSGPVATVFARLNRSVAAMAWDPGRHALWMVTWRSYSDGRLSRVGLDGSVQNWALPGGPNVQSSPAIQAGLVQPEQPLAWYGFDATDIVVDGQGIVWVAAGYGLVRFDPSTQKSQLKAFGESDPAQMYGEFGHWLSAIAPDGAGVLVAFNGESRLVHVDESLAELETITLSPSHTGVCGLAILGDQVLVGERNAVTVFDRSGKQMGEAGGGVGYRLLKSASADRAVVLPGAVGDATATVLGLNGAYLGKIAIPMEPLQTYLAQHQLLVATDWSDHVWYGDWNDESPIYMVQAAVTMP